MSEDNFMCPVVSIKVTVHPNADRLDIATCDNGLVSVIGKRQFKSGERVVCIPQHAIVPDDILEEIGLLGRLSGKKKNIVRPVKLKDVYSDCILYPLTGKRFENRLPVQPSVGTDMSEILGIVRRVTDHPMIFEGVVMNPRNVDKITYGKYDIENLHKWDGETNIHHFNGKEVYITEKIHGTWVEFSYHPQCPQVVTSKGFSEKELVFKLDENNKNNLYVKKYLENQDKVTHLFDMLRTEYALDLQTPIRLLGEIYGPKVQSNYSYGLQLPKFIAFDIYIGEYRKGKFMESEDFFLMCDKADIDTVPLLYRGPFDDADLEELGNGVSEIDFETPREGCVIKTVPEGWVPILGRTIAKYVSKEYLDRKAEDSDFS